MIIIENPHLARFLKKMGYRYKEVRTLGVFNKVRLYGFVFKDKRRIKQLIIEFELGKISIRK